MTQFEIIIGLLVTLVVIGGINLGLNSRTVYTTNVMLNTLPVVDPSCLPATNAQCLEGLSTTSAVGGVKSCQVQPLPAGTACPSTCHVTGTATTCDKSQACGSSDPTTCKGWCNLANPDFPMVGYEHSDCIGKLAFKKYYIWNTSHSSGDHAEQVWFSQVPGECDTVYGCRWFGLQLTMWAPNSTLQKDLLFDSNPPFPRWLSGTSTPLKCNAFLNMTNDECITGTAIPMDNEVASPVFRILLAPYIGANVTGWYFQGVTCIYTYACGVVNQTAYLDPRYLQGGLVSQKREATKAGTEVLLRNEETIAALMKADAVRQGRVIHS